jgi:hypothetical protein
VNAGHAYLPAKIALLTGGRSIPSPFRNGI